jgi:hypothetical protein
MKPVNDNKKSQLVNKQTLGDLNTGVSKVNDGKVLPLKVHKNENFFGFDLEFCTFSMLVICK